MEKVLDQLIAALEQYSPPEGVQESPVEGVLTFKLSEVTDYSRRNWRACLAVVARGCKEVVLENDLYRCDAAHYTATPISLPVTSRVLNASREKPALGILIDLDQEMLIEIAGESGNYDEQDTVPARAIFSGRADPEMLAAAVRLAKLFISPAEEARVLGPLIVKEMIFRLLRGKEGTAIRQYVKADSKVRRISHAVHTLRTDLAEDINVDDLSKTARMSRSAFFKYFKEVTAMSPIQFQKRLRLLEARRLMMEGGETAEGSAYRVGYKSASQFSREYSRMFGLAPAADKKRAVEFPDQILA